MIATVCNLVESSRAPATPPPVRASGVPAAVCAITLATSLAVVLWLPSHTWLVFAALAASTGLVLRRLTPPLQFFSLLFLGSFLLFPALAEQPTAEAGATVVIGLFLLGFLAGARMASRSGSTPGRLWAAADRLAPLQSLLIIAAVGLIVRVALLATGQVGLQAQYSSGSSESGPLALLATTGAAAAAAAFWAIRGGQAPGRWRSLFALSLVLGHAVSLAFSGFRGAGPSYLILVWVIGGTVRRRATPSPWAFKRVLAATLLVVLGVGLFVVGAVVREGYAAAAGKTSAGTTGVPTLEAVIERLDGRSAFEVAYAHRDDSLAQRAVDPRPQLAAAIPRILYPDKPVVDYGSQVAYAFYGLPFSYRTSSTITFLGDLYINIGVAGTFAVAVLLGFGLQRLSQRLMAATTGLSFALVYILSAAVVGTESPVLLNAVETLRQAVFLIVVLAVVRFVAPTLPSKRAPGESLESARRPGARGSASETLAHRFRSPAIAVQRLDQST